MRGGITLWVLGKIPPLPSCLAPPECCRSVPFCVPDDPQSHINKGGGSSIRGCYAWYPHEMRVTARNSKWPSSFFVLLIVFAFREAANPRVYLSFSRSKPAVKSPCKSCSKPAANQPPNLQQITQALHHTNKAKHSASDSVCLVRVLIPIHFVLDYLPDILQLTRN